MVMLFADYMPMPWWFLPALFAPLWVPILLIGAMSSIYESGRKQGRKEHK